MSKNLWFWFSIPTLAIMTSCFYSCVPLLSKIGMRDFGASPSGLLLCYGIMATSVSLTFHFSGVMPISLGSNYQAFPIGLLVGLLTSSAFICMNRAIFLDHTQLALVLGLVATAPLMSSLLDILLSTANYSRWQMILGCGMVVAGGIVLLTSKVPVTAQ